mmetsp:Transcript_49680/g.131691  ORF Transcript_49680/g.131691 Transcript_49680/m.131691 type:complete len:600 (-) Transcript_49680:442-2241(-)
MSRVGCWCSFIFLSVKLITCANFLAIGDVAEEEARTLYQSYLGSDDEKLAKFIAAVRPSYEVLPKNDAGVLGQPAVRYVLHRLFVQSYGWFIKGLEPHSDMENMPAHIRGLLPTGSSGASLHELAAIAASLEHLIRVEAAERLHQVLTVYKIDESSTMTTKSMKDVLSTYLMIYLKSGNITASSRTSAEARKQLFARRYAEWGTVKEWLHGAIEQHMDVNSMSESDHNVETLTSIVHDVDASFHSFFALDCQKLKDRLISLEDQQPGLVPLSAFYNQSLIGHWNFNEKVDYLRVLGALDESNPKRSNVIAANYVTSRPNCQTVSHFYSLCCRDECEGLLAQVEMSIGTALANPDRILSVVSAIPTGTAETREISQDLRSRLVSAVDSSGRVPIHGRLFAQWMHNVFPRECPYPHQEGTVSLWSAEEWTLKMGRESSQATPEEMAEVIAADTCKLSGRDGCGSADSLLPWSEFEELLEQHHSEHSRHHAAEPFAQHSDGALETDSEVLELQHTESAQRMLCILLCLACVGVLVCAMPVSRRSKRYAVSCLALLSVALTMHLLSWTTVLMLSIFCLAKVMSKAMSKALVAPKDEVVAKCCV